ncbi:DUF2695 domain-containing protein [Roseibium sp.]|uniref:DUF2695 domain-containing protein n=1 Tax=Roseibium sp. TaxID=1936156 RepID=UPI0032998489
MTEEEAASLLRVWGAAALEESDRDPSGYIYLAHMPATGHYKVGYSKKPEARVNHFDVQMPVEVKMLHSFPADDARACEQQIHNWAEPWRVNGEWFALPGGQALLIQYYRGYENGRFVTDPNEVPNLIQDLGQLPPREFQPHPESLAIAEQGRKQREKDLRERQNWPELERDLPASKPDLKRLFSHVRSAISSEGCDHTLRHTLSCSAANNLPEQPLVTWLQHGGGYCDCEVIANVAEMWEWRL